jgi:tRNA threonylcarbamoyladenosine biosynthesis protein TsaB
MAYARRLAVDTATLTQSIAVVDGMDVLAERTLRRRRGRGGGHSASLLAAIHGIVAECGMRFEDVDLLVAGLGPGSFTGLRIGLASLKGLAFATSIPLAGISSLEALAAGTGASGLIVPMFDARKQEVYAAAYRDGVAVLPDCAIGPKTLAERIRALTAPGENVTLLGEGLATYAAHFEGVGRPLGPAFRSPRASHLGLLAARLTPADVGPLATLEPNYQRASDAERDLANKKA